LAPSGFLLTTAGNVARIEVVVHMDTRTRENSIALLTKLRSVYQGQLDTSVIDEINAVIAALESCGTSGSKETSTERRLWVLKVISDVIRIVSNVTDLMR